MSGGREAGWEEGWTLILHNDDDHTFEYVIATLMEILDHSAEQAEQCAYLTHYKGSCKVKSGARAEIREKHDQLAAKGLLVSMDS